jgi:predicted nuclease of restriction endonuclease-like RecB superfamily
VIAVPFRPLTELHLFDPSDEPWIARLLDVAAGALGEPWRVFLERLDHAALGSGPGQVTAIANALRRVAGDGGVRARLAPELRTRLLGAPALDPAARDKRIAAAAAALHLVPAAALHLLWADLATERPVELSRGRPSERALAAAANLERIQRAVRRAHAIELRLYDDAHELVRAAARRGMLAPASRAPDGATVLELAGPLALPEGGAAYARMLAELVPPLAGLARFRLELRTRLGDGDRAREHTLRIEPPVLLPPPLPRRRRRAPGPAASLGHRLTAAGYAVEHEPPPLAYGDRLLFPDLAVSRAGTRWWIELLAFATDEHLARKLACYAAAATGVDRVVLCVDAARCPTARPGPAILPFRRAVDPAALLAHLAPPAPR